MRNFIYLLFSFVLFSCNNDLDLNRNVDKQNSLDILSFETLQDFEKAVGNVSEYELVSLSDSVTVLSPKNYKVDNFQSLYDVYIEAMDVAENYYETIDGYKEFKSKYNKFYYPEIDNDYSAYLPLRNTNIAKLLNKDGEVIIEGKKVSMLENLSYDELTEKGITPNSLNAIATKNIFEGDHNKLGEKRRGKYKLWVNVTTKRASSPGVMWETIFEVCFRKKGALGIWYNCSSETDLWVNSAYLGHKQGMSSHDYRLPRVFDNMGNMIPLGGRASIQFRKFGGVIYDFTLAQ